MRRDNRKVLLSVIVAIFVTATLHAQAVPPKPGVTFRQVPALVDYTFTRTPEPSFANYIIDLFVELRAIPTATIALAKIDITQGPSVAPTATPTVGTASSIVFRGIPANPDVTLSPDSAFNIYLLNLMAGLVALNQPAIDAVLTKYNVEVVSGTNKLFPRP